MSPATPVHPTWHGIAVNVSHDVVTKVYDAISTGDVRSLELLHTILGTPHTRDAVDAAQAVAASRRASSEPPPPPDDNDDGGSDPSPEAAE